MHILPSMSSPLVAGGNARVNTGMYFRTRTTATSRLCGEVTLAINSNKQLRATNDSQHELLIIARKSTYSMHCRTHSERLLVDTYHQPTRLTIRKDFYQMQCEQMVHENLFLCLLTIDSFDISWNHFCKFSHHSTIYY